MAVPSRIEININARKAAENVYLLAVTEEPPEGGRRYWESLATMVSVNLPKPAPDPATLPMSDLLAGRFETDTIMPWGKHAGKRIIEVPLEYLVWLVEQPDQFKDDLRRYLASERIKRDVRNLPDEDEDPTPAKGDR